MEAALKPYGIKIVNENKNEIKVVTTEQTWDPYSIIKARDFMKLVARGMGVSSAAKVLEDGMECGIHLLLIELSNNNL